MPKKEVFESGKLLRRIEFFPCARVNLAADPLHVEKNLRQVKAIRFQAQILNVIVPAGMFSKSRQKNLPARIGIQTADIFEQKSFIKVAHKA